MELAGVWMLTQVGMEEHAESLDLLPPALS